jgi:phytoene dehydrogenase-like protein
VAFAYRTADGHYVDGVGSVPSEYDVVVVGGGHNGLTAAAYLARAGRSVLVLERLEQTGGAARWSPEAALPEALVADLGLDLRMEPRPATDELAAVVVPTLLQPLPLEREIRARVDGWDDLVTTPLDLHRRLRASSPAVVGGGVAVADAVDRAARAAGADVLTSAGVSGIRAGADGAEVTWYDGTGFRTVAARHVLANVAPWVLTILLGEEEDPTTKPQGSDVLVRLRLAEPPPTLPAVDGGQLHWDAHTGTLTYAGPAGAEALLAGLGELEVVTPEDVERELAMPGGHWFHGELDWPWAPNRARLDTPAQQWGVQTDVASVLVCGAGSRRGGGVTGLGGHHAAHSLLTSR